MITTVRLKGPSKWFVPAVCIVGVIVLIVLFSLTNGKSFEPLQSLFIRDQVRLPINKTDSKSLLALSIGKPKTLLIPNINVDASIIFLGLTPNGAMDVPKNPQDVAWFDLGPLPGDIGSAVISGHYGWKNGIPAVFDDLSQLQVGNKLYVEDEKGTAISFVVTEIRTYDQNADTSRIFNSNDGKAHLNLITCGGVYDKTEKSYSNRVVVFSDKE